MYCLRPRQTCQTFCQTFDDGMFDVRIATSSNIIDKIRKLQSSYQSLLILMTKNQLEAQQEVG